jgi:hypothetical protein
LDHKRYVAASNRWGLYFYFFRCAISVLQTVTDYVKAGRPIWMTTIISLTTDSIVKIAILVQYVLNQYNLSLFKDEVYGIFNDALKDLGVDYQIVDDGDYDSLYGWQDMPGVFSGRWGRLRMCSQ